MFIDQALTLLRYEVGVPGSIPHAAYPVRLLLSSDARPAKYTRRPWPITPYLGFIISFVHENVASYMQPNQDLILYH